MEDATTILDLNDDCLLEVFNHLEWLDLCAVANVCQRFRQNAQAYSKGKILDLRNDIKGHGDTLDRVVFKTSKVLRHFGNFIVEFKEGGMLDSYSGASLESRKIYWRSIIELLARYSSQALTILELGRICCDSPFGERYRRLDCCEVSVPWRRFPKLKKIKLLDVDDFSPDTIVEMLKCNPQLKAFEFLSYVACLKIEILLPSIVEHIPEIETLSICIRSGEPLHILGEEQIKDESSKYFSQFTRLSSLELEIYSNGDHFALLAISAIAAANISLKHLHFRTWSVEPHVEFISKFKQLESLKLICSHEVSVPYFLEICRNCNQLSTIHLFVFRASSLENIIEIIKHSENLRSVAIKIVPFYTDLIERETVDINVFTQLLKIVKNRRKETRLEIHLDKLYYKIRVPNDLAKAHQDTLSIEYNRIKHYDNFV